MKTQIRLFFTLLLGFSPLLFSCSSDNDSDKNIDSSISKPIELDKPSIEIKLEQPTEEASEEPNTLKNTDVVSIINPNGNYTVLSLNEKVATANFNIEDNSIEVKGENIGQTKIFVLDDQIEVALIDVKVYQYDNIKIEEEAILEHTVKMGGYTNTSINIIEGNGGYSTSSSNENVLAEISGNTIQVKTNNISKDCTSTITVTDVSGFSTSFDIKFNITTEPFTNKELEDIKAITKQQFTFNNYTPSNYNMKYTNAIAEDNSNSIGVYYNDYWDGETKGIVHFNGERKVGPISNAQIEYLNLKGESSDGLVNLDRFEIIQVTDKFVYAIFSYIEDESILRYGYFVANVEPNAN